MKFNLFYILKSPGGVNDGLDLSVLEQRVNFADDIFDVFWSILLVEQVTQVETSESFVLVEKFDRRNFVDLPPLKMRNKLM